MDSVHVHIGWTIAEDGELECSQDGGIGRGTKRDVQGRRKRGRPNRRWMDTIRDDTREN